jgi:hypothetical protein
MYEEAEWRGNSDNVDPRDSDAPEPDYDKWEEVAYFAALDKLQRECSDEMLDAMAQEMGPCDPEILAEAIA